MPMLMSHQDKVKGQTKLVRKYSQTIYKEPRADHTRANGQPDLSRWINHSGADGLSNNHAQHMDNQAGLGSVAPISTANVHCPPVTTP